VVDPSVATLLPDDIWQALLEINDHTRCTSAPLSSESFNSVEILALKLAEASKRHHIRYPIGG